MLSCGIKTKQLTLKCTKIVFTYNILILFILEINCCCEKEGEFPTKPHRYDFIKTIFKLFSHYVNLSYSPNKINTDEVFSA